MRERQIPPQLPGLFTTSLLGDRSGIISHHYLLSRRRRRPHPSQVAQHKNELGISCPGTPSKQGSFLIPLYHLLAMSSQLIMTQTPAVCDCDKLVSLVWRSNGICCTGSCISSWSSILYGRNMLWYNDIFFERPSLNRYK